MGLFILLMGLLVPLLIAACAEDEVTAVPRPAATATRAPVPTASPQPTSAPAPTAMPQATSAPAPTARPQPTSTPPPVAVAGDTVEVSSQGSLGEHLVDAEGMTLYLFTKDERNVSNCSGGCAGAWPPLVVDGDPSAGEDLDAKRLGTIQRGDGSSQVTYNGKPLYYFAKDEKAGDTLGQDRGDVWFLVSPDGGPIRTTATVNATEAGSFGTILTDTSGNSLYLFTKDERNVTNCAGGCARAWPPLLTGEDPVAGEGLAESRIGTISRGGGAKQVTYNGWPLYYFAKDEKPGDYKGQDVGRVWFVVTTDGGAVYTSAPVNASESSEHGTILTDAAGRSLYLFTKDDPNVSNCYGGCALAWPPLITVEGPAPGEGVSAARIGSAARQDGAKQVTFDGNPLYYFAKDEKPGDYKGQDVGGVWYLISNAQPLMIILGEQSGSGQTGTAVLAGRGSFTNVSLSLSAGTLKSELVHIHDGQCLPGDLGGVVHALTSFEGGSGASVTNVPASLASLMTGGFAINAHFASLASQYTSCGNIPAAGDSLTIPLAELNGSGQTGFATLTDRGAQTEVVVSATPGISALAHIHDGSCQSLGGVALALSDTSGSISSTTVDATLDSLIAGSFAVNLHDAGDASVYTSCGNVAEAGQSLTIVLDELNGSGQSGWATLTNRGAQTEVVVSATSGISALAHIHNGSCQSLGGVALALSDTSGSTSSTIVDATLDSLIAGSFAVNLHDAGDASVYTSCGNVAEAGQSLTIVLDELNGSGQSGWATLTNRGAQTEVVVSATSGISAKAHIHNGSCQSLGGVALALSDTSGDTSSTTVDATLDSLIAGSFAINLHDAGDASVYTSCGNVAEAGQSLTIALDELNGSGQSGWATLTNRGAQTEVVVLATAGISALAHIHNGSCQSLGGVALPLSDTSGDTSSTTVDATLDSLIAGSFAVNLHKDGVPGVYTSCGNVAEAGQSLTITLNELNGSGQSGWATLTDRGAQTEVVVSATSGISALAHIHDGSCQTLGGVAYGLSDTSGSTSSTTVDVTLDTLIAGSFAVNLHDAADASVYTSCGDI